MNPWEEAALVPLIKCSHCTWSPGEQGQHQESSAAYFHPTEEVQDLLSHAQTYLTSGSWVVANVHAASLEARGGLPAAGNCVGQGLDGHHSKHAPQSNSISLPLRSTHLEARCGGTYLVSQLLRRLRQEDHKFKSSLDNLAISCLKFLKRLGCSSGVKHLLSMWEALSSTLAPEK